jgi:hypothetical protein
MRLHVVIGDATALETIRMGHGLWVHCDNRDCLHRTRIDLEAIAERYGQELPVAEFVNRSVCSECGTRWPNISISLDIAEFDGGLPRARAEARAFACCMAEWLNRNFVRSPPGRCLACDGGDHGHDPLLPSGIESTGHAWLHSRCWPTWHAGRKAEAIAALAAMGIAEPTELPDEFGNNEGG